MTVLLLAHAPLKAAEVGQIRLGDDYAQFYVGGSDWHPCEKECTADASCKSWTYLTTTGQCRLKHSVVPAHPNTCCVSGVKEETAAKPTTQLGSDERDCAKATLEAIDANDTNLANQCGLSGLLWSRLYNDLYAHCLDSSPRRRTRDADERKLALQSCQQVSGRSRSLVCDHYARMSVAEAASNDAANCGFGGPGWSGAYNEHVRWCQSANPSAVRDQIANREHQLLECLSRGGGQSDEACQGYASKAVSQFVESTKSRCGAGFSGTIWNDDQAEHYRWCRGHSPAEREDLMRKREAALHQCNDDRNHFRLIFKF